MGRNDGVVLRKEFVSNSTHVHFRGTSSLADRPGQQPVEVSILALSGDPDCNFILRIGSFIVEYSGQ